MRGMGHRPVYRKRNIFCFTQDCELAHLSETDESGIYSVDFKHIGQTRLNFIEFLFNEKDSRDLLYARSHDVRLALEDAFRVRDGILYLAPEMCLLYKSTDTEREGCQSDFDNAMSHMSQRQRRWLEDALAMLYPEGHKWRDCISDSEICR